MRALLAVLILLAGGCATARSPSVGSDYLTRLKEPVTLQTLIIPTHSGFFGILIVDAEGNKAVIYRDLNSYEGKDISGELVLGDFHGGRRVDYQGEEGAKLLLILDHIAPEPHLREVVRDFEASIRARRKEPNQRATDNSGAAPRRV